MIHYQLRCGAAHEFDAWFRDSAAYEDQAARGLLECPHCGERQVARAMMAPSVPRRRHAAGRQAGSADAASADTAEAGRDQPSAPETPAPTAPQPVAMPDRMRVALQLLRAEVERRCQYVGEDFAAEARRIHEGATPPRGIYGEATDAQAKALADDGIEVARIPWVPRTNA
jgi:hypothetical protein